MSRRLICLAFMGALLSGLAGCSDRMGDLQQYTNEVKARKGGHIEPIPQIKPFEVYTYADQDQRSPFLPSSETRADQNAAHGTAVAGLHPDFNRSHEHLESYPLDGLKMVGTLTVNGQLYALVRDSDNNVNQVAVGMYMGQNYGKVISITDSDIKLHEMVPDGQGGWSERVTEVTLSQ
jgi:type IV pilus assembly protein PilP